jgi:protein subunit release factor B
MRTAIMMVGFFAVAMSLWVALLMYSYHREAQANRARIEAMETAEAAEN